MIPVAGEWAIGLERSSPLAVVAIGGLLVTGGFEWVERYLAAKRNAASTVAGTVERAAADGANTCFGYSTFRVPATPTTSRGGWLTSGGNAAS